MPGQIATPVRLGRARQGIFNPGVAELAGLDAERIVQVRRVGATLWASFGQGCRVELAGWGAEPPCAGAALLVQSLGQSAACEWLESCPCCCGAHWC